MLFAGDPTKGIAADGSSFWLQWTDFAERSVDDSGEPIPADWGALLNTDELAFAEYKRRAQPYYALNLQRVDLE